MVGCIGDDAYGRMVLDNLHKYNINTDYLTVIEGENSGTAHITLAEGDNSIIVIAGANAKVDSKVVDNAWDAIKTADLVLVQNEIPLSTIAILRKNAPKTASKCS